MRACLPDIIPRLNTVVIDEIGHALTGQRVRRSLDLEVDMRLARISGVSNLCQNLTASHAVSRLYAQAAGLQVTVGRELLSAQIKHYVVTKHRIGRHFHGRGEFSVVPRHVVRKTIPHGYYGAICDSEQRLTISVVRALVARVSRKRLTVLTLLPIDRVTARDLRPTLDDENSATVVIVLITARAIVCEPIG